MGRLARRLADLTAALERAYGVPRRRREPPLDCLIGTILSQNTSDVNSDRQYEALRARFGTWERVERAPVGAIAATIRMGGLARIKAARITAVLRALRERRGATDLAFLRRMGVDDGIAALRELPGVGGKTAACVLLFSLRKPAFPVDTHVRRVARRLGLAPATATADQVHAILQPAVPPASALSLHVNLIRHGRLVCRSRPRCEVCVLRARCAYYRATRGASRAPAAP